MTQDYGFYFVWVDHQLTLCVDGNSRCIQITKDRESDLLIVRGLNCGRVEFEFTDVPPNLRPKYMLSTIGGVARTSLVLIDGELATSLVGDDRIVLTRDNPSATNELRVTVFTPLCDLRCWATGHHNFAVQTVLRDGTRSDHGCQIIDSERCTGSRRIGIHWCSEFCGWGTVSHANQLIARPVFGDGVPDFDPHRDPLLMLREHSERDWR